MSYQSDRDLPTVSDAQFHAARESMRPYTAVVLKAGPMYEPPGNHRSDAVARTVLEHAKRNYALRLAGLLWVVCPVADGSGVAGISIFDAMPKDVERIMQEDPAVKAGIFVYEIHPTISFPDPSLDAPPSARPV